MTDLEIPWSLTFAPDGRLFITERPGRVRIVNLSTLSSELALTLDGVYAQGEAGLLGLTLDPNFAQNNLVYLYYSAVAGGGAVNRIERYREVAGRLAERVVLLDGIPRRPSTMAADSSSDPTGSARPSVTHPIQIFRRTWRQPPARFYGSHRAVHPHQATDSALRCSALDIATHRASTGILPPEISGPRNTAQAATTKSM